MRAAVLHLAFAGLGAQHAVSGAHDHNTASLTVSRKLGYRDDGGLAACLPWFGAARRDGGGQDRTA